MACGAKRHDHGWRSFLLWQSWAFQWDDLLSSHYLPFQDLLPDPGEKTFEFSYNGVESGYGGPVWYAPAGADQKAFAQQLSFHRLEDPYGNETCMFSPKGGEQRFGLARVGSFQCDSEFHNTKYNIPLHRFVSSIGAWVWDDEAEHFDHHVDGFLSFVIGVLAVGGSVFVILGACFLVAAGNLLCRRGVHRSPCRFRSQHSTYN